MKNNVESRLEKIAASLGELAEEVIFVGASVSVCIVNPSSHVDLRETIDVDAYVPGVTSYPDMKDFEKKLVKAGFTRSDKKGDPTCRWKVDDIQFDVVPAKAAGTHSSNNWYFEATDASEEKKLSNGIKIRHLNSVYYIASKLEAFKSRGSLKDLMQVSYGGQDDCDNHDLEDIVLLLDGYNGFLDDFKDSKSNVKEFIKDEFELISNHPNFIDFLNMVLPQDSLAQRIDRIQEVISKMKTI